MRRTARQYDRTRILEGAARARAKRQRNRAIALYRWVLAVERNSVEVHERLAPLLAESGQDFDAWNSYRAVAYAALREGRDDRAIAVYREATRALPQEIQAWQGLARLLVRQGADDDAVAVLIEGSRCFRAHWNRPQAIHLLRRARAIDPWSFETVIELARHLGRAGQRAEAELLLDGLAERHPGERLRRVRVAQLAVAPGPRGLWAWLESWLRRPAPPESAAGDATAGARGPAVLALAPRRDAAGEEPVDVEPSDTDPDLPASWAR